MLNYDIRAVKTMKGTYKANLFALVLIIIQFIGGSFLSSIIAKYVSDLKIILVITQVLFLFVPTLLYFAITKENIKDVLKLRPLSFRDGFTVTIIAILAQPIAWFLSYSTSLFFENEVTVLFNAISGYSYIELLLILALVPAVFEELAIRGIVLSGYKKNSIAIAGLFTGVIFGILHLNPQQLLYTIALGMLFAYLVRITGSIYSSILAHFVFNGFQVTLSKITSGVAADGSGRRELLLADASIGMTLMNLIILGIFAVIFTMIILNLLRKLSRNNYTLDENIIEGINEEEVHRYGSGENPINLPFVTLVIFFVFIMVAPLMK